MKRFVALQEPTCTWAVLDTLEDVPAEFGDVVLIGLEKAEAVKLASLANASLADAEQTPGSGEGCMTVAGVRLVAANAA